MSPAEAAQQASAEPGQLLAGRYRLRSVLGRGAMGAVWQARDERLDRDVALKAVFAEGGLSTDEAGSRRSAVLREGRAAGQVRHAGAVAVHDVAVDSGQAWLVMELFAHPSLGARLVESGPLPAAAAAEVGARVAEALAAAHEAGVVHSDVKPGNILVGPSSTPGGARDTVKLTDFGIARMMSEAAGADSDDIVGTPVYFSPEVARGLDPTPASDVFSLGATVWTLVEGAPPFGGGDDDVRALLRRVAAAEVDPTVVPGALGVVLAQLMARDPAQRPDAATAAARLAAVARDPHAEVPGAGNPADGTPRSDVPRSDVPRSDVPPSAPDDDAPRSSIRFTEDDGDTPTRVAGPVPVRTVAIAVGVMLAIMLVVLVAILTSL